MNSFLIHSLFFKNHYWNFEPYIEIIKWEEEGILSSQFNKNNDFEKQKNLITFKTILRNEKWKIVSYVLLIKRTVADNQFLLDEIYFKTFFESILELSRISNFLSAVIFKAAKKFFDSAVDQGLSLVE
jgi:hypothetical protein